MKTVLHKMTMQNAIQANYNGPVFVPVMDDADKIPYGELMADIHKNRSPGNHKRFFAFIKQSFDMQDFYDEPEVWRKVIQMKAGFFDEVVTEKGKVLYFPQSIAWDRLDEIEFKDLFNRVINAFIRYYGDDLNEIEINSILEF